MESILINPRRLGTRGWLFLLVWLWVDSGPRVSTGGEVDFNRDVRPILSETCFQCHGPDTGKRKADLRLDIREGLFRAAKGVSNLVPGKPEESVLYLRISSDDDEVRMPPPKAGKPLTQEKVSLIRRWIEQGAIWKGHWAYLPLVSPALPVSGNLDSPCASPIDAFIRAGVAAAGLCPSPQADRATLIRRLSFDLLGLPPTPEEVDAFETDHSDLAYEHLVDRLLASPHYGERMALFWLDLVRYADTTGYHSDNHVDIYLFRDYVIRSFNANIPFNRFTIEQIAGDLVAAPTEETRIASGYNRLLQTTQEGGGQPKEYLAKYSADRVRNASSVWMGATMGCAECHDHKYDPFTTRDFYRFAAFFADLKETAVGVQEPTRFPSAAQAEALRRLDAQRAPLVKALFRSTPELEAAQQAWEQELREGGPAGTAKGKDVPRKILDIVRLAPPKRSAEQKKLLADHYRTIAPALQPVRKSITALDKQREPIEGGVPTSLVSMSQPPRVIRVLPRGNWLDESGPEVTPDVPAFLPPLGVKTGRPTRLNLARWLVAPENPLVARVIVNRLWKLAFGTGLVATADDFGSQGALPTHPELLDWMACRFRDSGWNVKAMLKLLVMSQTYRQSALVRDADRRLDPANRWLARQNRFRLDAEVVRDTALAASGLLSPRIGGPSVKPYQPEGYWTFLNFPTRTYVADKGENQYRRGLYTYWQRTFLHPSLLAFDASTREECVVQRPRSNTPIQALVLLNDPTYVESARTLAARVIREGGSASVARLQLVYRLVLGRPPRPEEGDILGALVRKHEAQYRSDPGAARELLGEGLAPPPQATDQAELAAWASLARVLLNLHETVTRN
jgi:hypothetical protein